MKQLKLLSRLIPQLSAFHASDNYPLPQTPTLASKELTLLFLIRNVKGSKGHIEEVCRHQKLKEGYLFTSPGLEWVETRLIVCLGQAYTTREPEHRGFFHDPCLMGMVLPLICPGR